MAQNDSQSMIINILPHLSPCLSIYLSVSLSLSFPYKNSPIFCNKKVTSEIDIKVLMFWTKKRKIKCSFLTPDTSISQNINFFHLPCSWRVRCISIIAIYIYISSDLMATSEVLYSARWGKICPCGREKNT